MAEDVTPLLCPDEESKEGCLLASGERADSGNHPVAASVLCLHNSSPLGYEGCHCIPVGNQHGNRPGDPGDSLVLKVQHSHSRILERLAQSFGPQDFSPWRF